MQPKIDGDILEIQTPGDPGAPNANAFVMDWLAGARAHEKVNDDRR